MSGSGNEKETSLIASLSGIVGIDLPQTISHVKKSLLNEGVPFGFDMFKKHSQTLKTLQELVAFVPANLDNVEKLQGEKAAVEGLVTDICLPFLRSFEPSFDGRADLATAVLNICDLILVCLKRSDQGVTVRCLELCLQSLTTFHHQCCRHSESGSDESVDILCALELLCTTLEVPNLTGNNQSDDLYYRIFTASLMILSHLEEKNANRLISFILLKLVQLQVKEKDRYLLEMWNLVQTDVLTHNREKKKMSSRTLQQHQTMMCIMANFFFPLTDDSVKPDVREHQAFWELVQLGLYHENPATRKRSMYLLKRIVDTCEKSGADFLPSAQSLERCLPYFWWSKQHQKQLSRIWEDIFLLLETLDEKQTHVIKPILPRFQSLVNASKEKNGSKLLHTSWVVTILMRAFAHESVYIIRWAAETVLFMDFSTVPFMQQGQLQFLTKRLLLLLQDLKLFQRADGSPLGSCTTIGAGLRVFFASVIHSLDDKQNKVEFVQHVLGTLLKENWGSVPLVFITQGLSCISPCAVLDLQAISMIRDFIIASLTTLESFTRAAIECFMTKTVLNLLDKEALGVEDLMETLAVMEREESLQRGTSLWSSVVSWLLASAADSSNLSWTWDVLQKCIVSMMDNYLTVTSDTVGSPLAETLRVTKIARLVVLMVDCESRMRLANKVREDGNTSSKSLLAVTLCKAVDIINSINTRAYMPLLKADRAICLVLACARELGKDKDQSQDSCYRELSAVVQSIWNELVMFVERRTLQETEQDAVDLDLVIFYADTVKELGELLPCGARIVGMERLVDSCSRILVTPSSAQPLQRVAAASLMSSVAQAMASGLKREVGVNRDTDGEEQTKLFCKLWNVFSTMSLDCSIFVKKKGGSSAQQGRQVCQYMMSIWKCLCFLLSSKPELCQAQSILDAALDAFSISSGECDIPIMQCLELIMPKVLQSLEQVDKIIQVIKIAWDKVREEIKSWSFWLKMEAYVNMVLQHPLLLLTADKDNKLGACVLEVLDRFFEVGEEKSGLLNLVMARLTQLWSGPEGPALATLMSSTVVDACMFGTLHKKAERMWLDVCMYIETLKEDCSVNEILSSASKNDIYTRLITVNFLSTLKPDNADHQVLVLAVLREAWTRYLTMARMSTFRQFTNTLPHRQKHRLVQIFPLLDQFVDKTYCHEFFSHAWDALVIECHPSVRQNLEWLVMRLLHRYPHDLLPFLWKYFDQFSDKRNISLLSLLHIITRIGPELPPDLREDYYMQAIPLVVPWSMAHHFNTRLHGQAAMHQLWTQYQQMQLQVREFKIVESSMKFLVENGLRQPLTKHQDNVLVFVSVIADFWPVIGNSSAVLGKLLENYFYNSFHFLRDYSMETLFFTLPRLSCLGDDEWMHPDLFDALDASWRADSTSHLMRLYNEDNTLAACPPGPWKMKATAENSDEACESTEGDVQKKIIPWRLMTPDNDAEQEYTYRKKGRKRDGLVLVTSLINKIPNLGGLCRTSEIFGVSEFVISNLSYLNDRIFQSLSVTAEKWIPITEVQTFRLGEFLEEKKRESYTLVGVEQTANSVDLTNYRFPKKTLLVLGNEKAGIPPDVLQQLDVCVEIPQQGIIRSLNVHVSGALLVWEYTRQQMEQTNAE